MEEKWQKLLYEIKNGNYQQAIDWIEEINTDLFCAYIEDQNSLRAQIHYYSTELDYYMAGLKGDHIDFDLVIRLGALLGTIEFLSKLMYEQDQTHWSKALFDKVANKRFFQIMESIDQHGPMSAAKLSTLLKIDQVEIMNELKSMLQARAILSITIGRETIYCLTDMGIRYTRLNKWKDRR